MSHMFIILNLVVGCNAVCLACRKTLNLKDQEF